MAIEKFFGTLNNRVNDGFTTLLSSVIQSIHDPAALGLYVYLASLPPTWEINILHLQKHFDKGRDFIYDKLNFLLNARLLERVEERKGGKFVKYEYNLYISPLPCLPEAVLPYTVNTDTYK